MKDDVLLSFSPQRPSQVDAKVSVRPGTSALGHVIGVIPARRSRRKSRGCELEFPALSQIKGGEATVKPWAHARKDGLDDVRHVIVSNEYHLV